MFWVFQIQPPPSEPDIAAISDPSQQEEQYITSVESGEDYTVVVVGDSIGNGLWQGLTYGFRDEKIIKIVKKSRVSTGLVREDYYNWPQALENILQTQEFQVAVVLFGTNDRQAIRTDDGIFRIKSDEWKLLYRARVDRIMEQLKEKNIAIYWVGLPIMRSPSFSRHADLVNQIVRASAEAHEVKFIETWDEFADSRGRYNAYGTGISGRKRKLRAGDGIHLTVQGYRKLALAVEQEIRRDLAAVLLDNGGMGRNVPILPTLRPDRSAELDSGYDVADYAPQNILDAL